MQLSEIIIQRIREGGPLSFRDFMDMALYHPVNGYYTSEKDKIGRRGDYFTSPVLSSLYGQMLGRQLEEIWSIMDKDAFTIVEYGAGTGALCFDILNYLKKNTGLYQNIKYYIIEKSEAMILKQRELLNEKVEWIDSISEISGFTGCVLSNEVIDNFPVHLVVMENDLMEVFVDYQNGFAEVLRPASPELKNYLAEQNISLPAGYRTEINMEVPGWIRDIAFNLKKGFVITVDYGFTSKELYNEKRNMGTLACYYQHRVSDLPYCNIGQQDITAHVNFSALDYWGKKYGLECVGFCNQDYFLRSLGLANYLREKEVEDPHNNKDLIMQGKKLLLDMGNKFKVLIQQKAMKSAMLTGMQFSRQIL